MSWCKVLAATSIGLMSCLAPVAAPAPALAAAQTVKMPATPSLTAATACVVDVASGQVLLDRNAHVRRANASTTKILTSLIAVESGRLDEVVTISKRASSIGEATIYLKEGERLTLRELLYGVLLSSGNDASTAVAEFLGGGSEEKFVEMMNERVKQLGLKDTHFSNPHGLPSDNHYSSAYDLAMLLREAMKYPDWCQIAEAKFKQIPMMGKPNGRTLKSHNKLLWSYPYATGGKTGYTFAAGRCFVGSARKGSRAVVQAVMAAPELWEDSQKLLAYGLENFETVMVARKGEVVGTVPIQAGSNRVVEVIAPRDVSVCLPKGAVDRANLQQVWQLPDELTAPVEENQPVGKLIVRQGESVLTTVPLVAAASVPVAAGAWDHISSWFFPGMLAASVLSLFRLQEVRKKKRVRRVRRAVKKKPVQMAKRPVARRKAS